MGMRVLEGVLFWGLHMVPYYLLMLRYGHMEGLHMHEGARARAEAGSWGAGAEAGAVAQMRSFLPSQITTGV